VRICITKRAHAVLKRRADKERRTITALVEILIGVLPSAESNGGVVAAEKINSTIKGAAAEHFVMCQLLRLNMIAALAPAGVPDADIIVSDVLGGNLCAIQVKARQGSGGDGGWQMKKKHEKVDRPRLFYAFVDFDDSLCVAPKTWIVPSHIVAEVVTLSHQRWLAAPGAKGQAHNDTDLRRFLPHYKHDDMPNHREGWLAPYEEAWDLIRAAS